MVIQKQIENYETIKQCEAAIENLKSLREEAFKLLIDEELKANESFTIFTNFLSDIQQELENKMAKLKGN